MTTPPSDLPPAEAVLAPPPPATAAARVAARVGLLRALANPDYRIYAAGNAISVTGSWVQRVAVGWLAWQLTESAAWLGVIAFAELLPSVVISPFAGAIADRFDRLWLFRIAQALALVQALLLLALTALGWITIELLVGLTVYLGCVIGFAQPVRLSLIPSLVRRADLSAAIAGNSLLFNGARFLGPAIAGVVIVSAGTAPAFAINAATYLVFLLALSRLRPAAESGNANGVAGMLSGIRDGFAYALRHREIAPILLLIALTSFFGRPFAELLPGFAAEVFGRGADGLAWLTSATGLGAMAGGLWLSQRRGGDGLTRFMLASCGLLGIALLAFAVSDRFWVAVPCLALAGFAMVVCTVGAQTLIQATVDGAMRGRVLSLYGLLFRAGVALGSLAMGAAATGVGLRVPIAAGALVCVLAALWAFRRRRRLAAGLEAERG